MALKRPAGTLVGLRWRASPVEPDFDHAMRRHRMLDAIRRASETGQRQEVVL